MLSMLSTIQAYSSSGGKKTGPPSPTESKSLMSRGLDALYSFRNIFAIALISGFFSGGDTKSTESESSDLAPHHEGNSALATVSSSELPSEGSVSQQSSEGRIVTKASQTADQALSIVRAEEDSLALDGWGDSNDVRRDLSVCSSENTDLGEARGQVENSASSVSSNDLDGISTANAVDGPALDPEVSEVVSMGRLGDQLTAIGRGGDLGNPVLEPLYTGLFKLAGQLESVSSELDSFFSGGFSGDVESAVSDGQSQISALLGKVSTALAQVPAAGLDCDSPDLAVDLSAEQMGAFGGTLLGSLNTFLESHDSSFSGVNRDVYATVLLYQELGLPGIEGAVSLYETVSAFDQAIRDAGNDVDSLKSAISGFSDVREAFNGLVDDGGEFSGRLADVQACLVEACATTTSTSTATSTTTITATSTDRSTSTTRKTSTLPPTPTTAETSKSISTPTTTETSKSISTPTTTETSKSISTPTTIETSKSISTPTTIETSKSISTPTTTETSTAKSTATEPPMETSTTETSSSFAATVTSEESSSTKPLPTPSPTSSMATSTTGTSSTQTSTEEESSSVAPSAIPSAIPSVMPTAMPTPTPRAIPQFSDSSPVISTSSTPTTGSNAGPKEGPVIIEREQPQEDQKVSGSGNQSTVIAVSLISSLVTLIALVGLAVYLRRSQAAVDDKSQAAVDDKSQAAVDDKSQAAVDDKSQDGGESGKTDSTIGFDAQEREELIFDDTEFYTEFSENQELEPVTPVPGSPILPRNQELEPVTPVPGSPILLRFETKSTTV